MPPEQPSRKPGEHLPIPSASSGRQVRVLVVDDSSFMRRAMTQMISSGSGLTVVGTASNGQDAIEQTAKLKPDVVTLDIEMPVMDGLTALRKIRLACTPAPAVLVCSSLTSAGSHEALKALRLGAADVIAKDSSNFSLKADRIRDDLLAKIKAIAAGRTAKESEHLAIAASRIDRNHKLNRANFDLMVIGSSTGGPPVLETILTQLPADLPVPVVVAQHMPVLFTKSLSERLDDQCAVSVMHAEPGMTLSAGVVYIAPGGKHTRVIRSGSSRLTLEISPEPLSAIYKPSVNELFASAAKACGGRTVAAILTGMGDDGVVGAKDLRAKGATILAQDMQSCVVYGMPKAVAQAGLADGSLAPEEIAQVLASLSPGRGGVARVA